jgi:hypothetical protein
LDSIIASALLVADFIDSIDPNRTFWRYFGEEGVVQLLRVTIIIKRATLAIRSVKSHVAITGTPDLGADGKDCRANSVHAPFPEKSVSQAPLRRSVVRRLSACETWLAM